MASCLHHYFANSDSNKWYRNFFVSHDHSPAFSGMTLSLLYPDSVGSKNLSFLTRIYYLGHRMHKTQAIYQKTTVTYLDQLFVIVHRWWKYDSSTSLPILA